MVLRTDGLAWTPLPSNLPVALGTGMSPAVRDSHIGRVHAGTFHRFFTGGWDAAAFNHATSLDLLDWSAFRPVGAIASIVDGHNHCGSETEEDAEHACDVLLPSSMVHVDGPGGRGWGRWDSAGGHRIRARTRRDVVS